MTSNQKKELLGLNDLRVEEAQMLKEAATQARFTWVVLVLTFITALIGLLSLIKTFQGNFWEATFMVILDAVYAFLVIGVYYSVFGVCRTTFIIDLLAEYKQSQAVKDFLHKNWEVNYVDIIRKKGNDGGFRERRVQAISATTAVFWLALFVVRIVSN